ncbi:siderophore biosynthesis PLP-dependent protein [Bacillus sp. AFS015802]|uniref:type III PLP-dependent enzyme n=1 Tax=Bacillus sp. AFS015802 TaxID=2033486 RepID=UPI000BF878CD|nr:type III PLP-dependent enzyme [Bacillus sp. AFS015802]PFA67053.1 siderophore biosynthesis PLP-dependent protein [Bacillus sp. AFS015802]
MISKNVSSYLPSLIKKRGADPICAYLYDIKHLKNHARQLRESLPSYCSMFYAVKANPDKNIILALEGCVDGFDTASEGELVKVMDLTGKPIIFGAPAKKDRELKYLSKGKLHAMNIESERDLHRLNRLGSVTGEKLPVLIRVNSTYQVERSSHKMTGVPTQFGIEEERIPSLLNGLSGYPYLEVRGFHFHAMSNNLNARDHLDFIQFCREKVMDWKTLFSLPAISILNAGGGIGLNYGEREQPFEWETFTKGLHEMEALFQQNGIQLILELGRYMVGGSGYYVAEVMDIKENHGEHFALIRGGSHHLRLPAAWKMTHPHTIYPVDEWYDEPLPRPEVRGEYVTVAGELCTPNDLLIRKSYVEKLRAGDLVVFSMAGAYGWTISHHDFLSHPQPEFHYL